ncbi:MAG: hypothetical protein ACYSTL_00340 [Planctomycetota bacterium]|jgi:hypothetical protein
MENKRYPTVTVDGYTRFILTVIAVLLTVMAIGLWSDAIDPVPAARAEKFQDPKAAEAFKQGRWGTSSAAGKLAAVQSETNVKLDELIRVLKSGEAKVQIIGGAAEASGGKNARKKK